MPFQLYRCQLRFVTNAMWYVIYWYGGCVKISHTAPSRDIFLYLSAKQPLNIRMLRTDKYKNMSLRVGRVEFWYTLMPIFRKIVLHLWKIRMCCRRGRQRNADNGGTDNLNINTGYEALVLYIYICFCLYYSGMFRTFFPPFIACGRQYVFRWPKICCQFAWLNTWRDVFCSKAWAHVLSAVMHKGGRQGIYTA